MPQTSFNFQSYIIVDSDSKRQRLTKLRDFLHELKEVAPHKFNYASYIEAIGLTSEGLANRSQHYYNVIKPEVKQPIYNCPVTPDSVREKAFNDEVHCGTCACVAGWATILSKSERLFHKKDEEWDIFPDFCEIAASVLMLDQEDAEFLFYGHSGYQQLTLDIYSRDKDNIDEAIHRINILIEQSPSE